MASVIDTYSMPPLSLLREHAGACRYISHTSGKTLTRSQVKTIHGENRVIVTNFEDTAENARGGYSQGVADGTFYVAQMRYLKAPQGIAGYFSVDYEVHTGQPAMGTVLAYFRGVGSVLRPAGFKVGAYGCRDVIRALFDASLSDYGWQCAAWSYGAIEPRAHLYQNEYRGSYDVNEIRRTDFGAWTPTGPQTRPLPPFEQLLEQLMSWYKTQAEFEAAVEKAAARGVADELMNVVVPLSGKVNGRKVKPAKLGHVLSVWHQKVFG